MFQALVSFSLCNHLLRIYVFLDTNLFLYAPTECLKESKDTIPISSLKVGIHFNKTNVSDEAMYAEYFRAYLNASMCVSKETIDKLITDITEKRQLIFGSITNEAAFRFAVVNPIVLTICEQYQLKVCLIPDLYNKN